MNGLVERHRRACDGFGRVADVLRDDQWDARTPCTDWDARAVVEHVIGFHEFLLLRPLGLRAQRPKTGPAARWHATAAALFDALGAEEALDRETSLPGGGTSSPRTMLGALTVDVLVHTWDLARAGGIDPELDPGACAAAYDAVVATGIGAGPASDLYAAAVSVPGTPDAVTRLVARCGRDPAWSA